MSRALQTFLATATTKAAAELVAAYLRVPEEKRAWKPEETSRTALDQMAECAVLNGYTANLIHTRVYPADRSLETFLQKKNEAVESGWESLQLALEENTRQLVEAIGGVADDELEQEIELPWGKPTLAEILGFPYWNMSYHQGQVNYIASLLGCL